jgi:hypothetical protein
MCVLEVHFGFSTQVCFYDKTCYLCQMKMTSHLFPQRMCKVVSEGPVFFWGVGQGAVPDVVQYRQQQSKLRVFSNPLWDG